MNAQLHTQITLETLHEIIDDLDYYQVLRIDQQVEPAAIFEAYKEESKRLHPDRCNNLPEFKDKANYIYTAINEAFRVLKDPVTRLAYDSMLANGTIRIEDTALRNNADRMNANDPANAATTEEAKKYWSLALEDFEAKRFSSSILNIKFALQFERDNETFKEWLEKAKEEERKAPKKEKNPYKIRL
jgi:curved DNA-binding protein CbpA